MRIDLTAELPGMLDLRPEADTDRWPAMHIELEVRSWHKPEPDVGIFGYTPDDLRFYGQVTVRKRDGAEVPIAFDDQPAFARHVWAWIGADVHEPPYVVAEMLENRVTNALADMEPGQ